MVVIIEDNVLIYDIETLTFGKPDSSKDRLRVFGCHSYKTKKPYMLSKKEDTQKVINAHKFLVGFNNKKYDNPILVREGVNLNYKIIVDLREIFIRRAGGMKTNKGMLGDIMMEYSLDYITKMLDIVNEETGKDKIDYSIFQKATWTKEETDEIIKYTKKDIEVTRKLYEWVEEYFQSLKFFISEEDVRKKVYLTSSLAKFTYKAICKAMKWEETYAGEGSDESIQGGYVSYPAGERFEGNIYCLDFNSLYPFIMIMCNLYGRIKNGNNNGNVWFGDNKWKVEGAYNSKELNEVCKLLLRWYKDRLVYKKEGDRREYTIKIILNTIYGILTNPYYTLVYDLIGGGDCTRIGRQWVKYARKVFREAGYEIIYTDTDSIYIKDLHNDKEKMLKVKDKIINDIKETVPFPQDMFDMGIDDEIKYMFFFKGGNKEEKDSDIEMDSDDFLNKPKGFMKKNYVYVKKVFDKDGNYIKDEVVIKNLGVRKKSNSGLSKEIFWKHMVPKIIDSGECKFSKAYVKNLINELLEKDIGLAALRKDVGQYSQYASTSPNSLPAQVSKKYGSGIHFLIPNTKGIGVGKGKSYCNMEEFKQNNLRLEHIDLTNVWKELEYFIKPIVMKNIFAFEEKTSEV